MNTHKILSEAGYNGRPNYGEIARFAAEWFREHPHTTSDELVGIVGEKFGYPQKYIQMREPLDFPIWGRGHIDQAAIKQMNTVMSLPVAVAGAMMPDAHLGYGMPIGGVAALDNAISPSFVGYDIACRMRVSLLDISPEEFMVHREQIAADMRAVSRFGVGAAFDPKNLRNHLVMDDPLWDEFPHLRKLKPLAHKQLGTSGGGNHFFDALIGTVVADDLIFSDPHTGPKREVGDKFVTIMTHSGSRGVGHKTATHYMKLAKQYTAQVAKDVPNGYEWLSLDTDAGREYLRVMNLMGKYAKANHQLIHQHFRKRSGINFTDVFDHHHNFAWVQDDGTVIHRKGATPARKGQIGIIPGSSGTASYLVEGMGNPRALHSSSHGAGRPFSRKEAKRRHKPEAVKEIWQTADVLTFGVAADETPLAYKDIDHVMDMQADLVKPIAKMVPKIVIMGGKENK